MKIKCAIVGATGIAGQQFLAALRDHPYFEIAKLAASERSAGKLYQDAITTPAGGVGWYVDCELPQKYAQMKVENAATMSLEGIDLVFSAIESDAAREIEKKFAESVPVVSTASAYRYEEDVPIIIPAVNGDHAKIIDAQRKNRSWRGYIVPIPNCTTTGLAIALAPLAREYGIEKVIMTSMQSISGSGRSPGVIGLDIIDNVIPYIPKEEEKVERETQKILGGLNDKGFAPYDVNVSCTCTRVGTLDGHFETVNVALKRAAPLSQVQEVWGRFGQDMNPSTHPSAPVHWVSYTTDPFRPQPRRDRDGERGMTTTIGRLRSDTVIGAHGLKFCLVSHNTRMGAALGAVLVAEDLKVRGYL